MKTFPPTFAGFVCNMKMDILLRSFAIVDRLEDGRPKKVACKVEGCSSTSVANQTRMAEHLQKKHPTVPGTDTQTSSPQGQS